MSRRGLIINEPTIVLRQRHSKQYMSYGKSAAEELLGPNSTNEFAYPFKDGVIADYDATRALLAHYVYTALGRFSFAKPNVLLTISSVANSSERRAMLDAAYDAGFNKVYLIPTLYAAAMGAGVDITQQKGTAVLHLGAGVCEFAVFALGAPVAENGLKIGSHTLNESIRQRVRREHGVILDDKQLEVLMHEFIDLGAQTIKKPITMQVRKSRSKETKKVIIKNELLVRGCESQLERLVRACKKVINDCPPDLIADIIDQGVLLTGGLSKINGIDQYLSNRLKLAFMRSEEPILAPVRGLSLALVHLKNYERNSGGQLSSKGSIESIA